MILTIICLTAPSAIFLMLTLLRIHRKEAAAQRYADKQHRLSHSRTTE